MLRRKMTVLSLIFVSSLTLAFSDTDSGDNVNIEAVVKTVSKDVSVVATERSQKILPIDCSDMSDSQCKSAYEQGLKSLEAGCISEKKEGNPISDRCTHIENELMSIKLSKKSF